MSIALLRGLAWGVPALLTPLVLLLVPRRDRTLGACLLSFTWGLATLPPLNAAAVAVGWWSFDADGGLFLGVPVDVLLGWALLWGPLALVLGRELPLFLVCGLAVFADAVLMPHLTPLLTLHEGWWIGEIWLALLALVPAQLLGRWTWDDTQLDGRVGLHLAQFVLLVCFLLPHTVLAITDSDWSALWALEPQTRSVLAQVMALVGLPGLSAVLEFRERGGGTPVPFDGPKRLVQSGPYAYVRNPMQASTALGFFLLGAVLWDGPVALIGWMAVVFGAGFAAWHEQSGDLDQRLGPEWQGYRAAVPAWVPRWRPHVPQPSILWVARSCGPCRAVGNWLLARSPVGLELRAAEDHPTRLRRMRYEAADGHVEDGVGALARALEHIHLLWALVGMAARLPGVRAVVQLLLDAFGGGPRDLE